LGTKGALVKTPLQQHQFDALADFAYQMGAAKLQKSQLLNKINSGSASPEDLHRGFHGWNRGGPGVPIRRDREIDLFNNGIYRKAKEILSRMAEI
jgi:GH24 family phage-related lysozyme (muramidase)